MAENSAFLFLGSTFGYVLIFERDKLLNVIDYPATIPFYDYISSYISYSLICITEIIVFGISSLPAAGIFALGFVYGALLNTWLSIIA